MWACLLLCLLDSLPVCVMDQVGPGRHPDERGVHPEDHVRRTTVVPGKVPARWVVVADEAWPCVQVRVGVPGERPHPTGGHGVRG